MTPTIYRYHYLCRWETREFSPEMAAGGGMVDLSPFVDKSAVSCLNEDPRAPSSNLWTTGNEYVCRCAVLLLLLRRAAASHSPVNSRAAPMLPTRTHRSRDDEQLLLHVPFTQEVKIFAMDMVSKEEPDAAPTTVRLFVNQDDVDFSTVEDLDSAQTLELTATDLLPDRPTKLKFTKFQQVSSITLFVEDNGGSEYSVISSLRFFGRPTTKVDMSKGLQKC